MTSALEYLLSLRDADDRFDTPPNELLPLQLEAAAERLDSQIEKIPLLKNRADTGDVSKVAAPADLVPLLFAHNTYKTYSETWLLEGNWDRMAKWLQTVTTYEAGGSGYGDVDGLDEWVERLESEGQFVACSSGTTGKPAMLGAAESDLEFASLSNVSSLSWATGIKPTRDRRFFGIGPRTNVTRNEWTRTALIDAFGSETETPYQLPLPMITVGSIMAMILLRRRIGDGSATAGEVAEFESLSAARSVGVEDAMAEAIDEMIKSRDQKLLVTGMYQMLYPIAAGIQAKGFGAGDFHPENALLTGGGLKGAQLPSNYREVVLDTFNIAEHRTYDLYGMQEINTPFPACRAGRYHVAPWVLALPLDATGETLLDTSQGEIEARAAFLDLSLDGRWGGVISGDRVNINFGVCPCGRQGPTVGRDIVRFADLEGGDKISCSGTIDAYVRGGS